MSDSKQVLCLDIAPFRASDEIQKDILLADLFKFVPLTEEECAQREGFAPVALAVSVRSSYTNKVLGFHNGDADLFYRYSETLPPISIMTGNDLFFIHCAQALSSCLKLESQSVREIIQRSNVQLIGLYNPNPGTVNPILLAHVVFFDEDFDLMREHWRDDAFVEDISKARDAPGNLKALTETLLVI